MFGLEKSLFCNKITLGAIYKGRLHKIAKILLLPLSAKCPHWLSPLVRADTP